MKIPSIRLILVGLTAAAVAEQLRRPESERDWHGAIAGVIPYDFRPPTLERLRETYWAPDVDELFRPHVFGVGWGLNVGRLVKIYRDQLRAQAH
ncbi:MAG: hypothetical protein QOF57_2265 [Frankiaceae bacterium]|nr:hypothetical protein [Frankiaceae bacterium]